MSNSNSFLASKSYQRITKTLFYFSAFFSFSGLIFKIQHYPGSDILLPIGLMLLSIVSVLLTLEPISLEKESNTHNYKLLIFHRYILGYGSAIFSIGGLFYIQHYPGGYMLSAIGFLVSLFCLIFSIYLSFSNKNSVYSASKLNSIFLLTFFIWGASGYFMRVSKSVLSTYVSLNYDIQLNAEQELLSGDREIEQFKSKKSNSNDQNKLKLIAQIDNLTANQIKYLDALKMEILTEIKEDPYKLKPSFESIIMVPYEDKFPLRPIRMQLSYVTNKDKYDEVMRIFGIANNIKKPESYKCKSSNVLGGIDMWNSLLKYRAELCSILVNYGDSSDSKFVDPKITKFGDLNDLQSQVQNSLRRNKLDLTISPSVEEIYISLSKHEQWESEFYLGGVHWLGKTFDHAPAIAAICLLSNLQKEALSARKIAIHSILNK
jgi:hypothetical protein